MLFSRWESIHLWYEVIFKKKKTCQDNRNTSYICVDMLMQIQLYYFVSHWYLYISTCANGFFWIVKMKTKLIQVENL